LTARGLQRLVVRTINGLPDAARETGSALRGAADDLTRAYRQLAVVSFFANEPLEILCECSRAECTQRLHVSLPDYRTVRENDARFMLVDGHVDLEIERRVDEVGDATVVEKFGPGREVAVESA